MPGLLVCVRAIAMLVGLALVFALTGYIRLFDSIFGPSRTTGAQVFGVACLCASLGPWAVRHLAARLSANRGGLWSKMPTTAAATLADEPDSIELPWLLQSILGVGMGLLMLAGLVAAAAARSAWAWLREAFFWTYLTESICAALMIAAVIGVLSVAAGIQLISLYLVAFRMRALAPSFSGLASTPAAGTDGDAARPAYPPDAGVAGGLLLGIAAGAGLQAVRASSPLAAEQWVLLGAVASFGVSALSAYVTRGIEPLDAAGVPREGPRPAVDADWSPTSHLQVLALGSLWAWGISTGLWAGSVSGTGVDGSGLRTALSPAWLAASLSCGAWASGRIGGRRKYSIGGYGVALWLAGVSILASVGLASFPAAPSPLVAANILLTGALVGHSLPYGRRSFLARSLRERQALAQWLSTTLLGLMTGVWAAEWFHLWAGTGVAGAAAACLLLLISGGLLQIHEDDGVRRVRQRRLAAVFVSLGLALWVLPPAARRASQFSAARALAVEETLDRPTDPLDAARNVAERFGLIRPGSRVAWLGSDNPALHPECRVTGLPWGKEASRLRRHRETDPTAASWDASYAERWCRHSRTRYDLIVQTAKGLSDAEVADRLSAEWLTGLRGKLVPEGAVLIALPAPLLRPEVLRSVAATVQDSFRPAAAWLFIAEDERSPSAFVLACLAWQASVTLPAASESLGAGPRLRSLSDVTAVLGEGRIHSLRAPAFTAAGAAPEPVPPSIQRLFGREPPSASR